MKKLTVTLLTCLFVLSPDVVLSETIDDLVERGGLHYKKFTDVPFSGEVTGKQQGKFKDGVKEGPWAYYWESGQLSDKGTLRDVVVNQRPSGLRSSPDDLS